MASKFSDAEIAAAARKLNAIGRFHGWFHAPADYREMDPIAVREFEGVVEEILTAAAKARRGG